MYRNTGGECLLDNGGRLPAYQFYAGNPLSDGKEYTSCFTKEYKPAWIRPDGDDGTMTYIFSNYQEGRNLFSIYIDYKKNGLCTESEKWQVLPLGLCPKLAGMFKVDRIKSEQLP
jgi:hypothetical protein